MTIETEIAALKDANNALTAAATALVNDVPPAAASAAQVAAQAIIDAAQTSLDAKVTAANGSASAAATSASNAAATLAGAATKVELAAAATLPMLDFTADESQSIFDNALPMQSFAALRAYTGRAAGVRITTPRIAGNFYRDASDSASADDGGAVIVDASGRRWKRLFNGGAAPEYWGAVGDGVADDTTPLASAIAYAKLSSNGEVILSKQYRTTSKTVLPSAVALVGHTKKTLDSGYDAGILYAGSDACIEIEKTTDGSYQHNTRIDNVSLRYVGAASSVNGVRQNLSSAMLRDVKIYDFTGNGLDAATCIFSTYENLRIFNCAGAGAKLSSPDPIYPGGQAIFINPQILRCGTGLHLENYQTVQVLGGTVSLNIAQQMRILGCSNVGVRGAFFEPRLGAERTYFDKLIEVAGTVVNSTTIVSGNIEIVGCNLYAGQAGATARVNYGVHAGNVRNLTVVSNTITDFPAAGVKIVFDTNIATQYRVGPNRYSGNALDFDRAGSSSAGWDAINGVTTLTNESLTISGTGKLTVQGTWQAPFYMGANALWVDATGKLRIKSGAPASDTDGSVVGTQA